MAALARPRALTLGEIALKQKLIVKSLAAAGLVTALGFGVSYYEPLTAHARTVQVTEAASAQPVAALPDFSKLVEQYGPAVVNISVTQNIKTSAAMPDLGLSPDDPMYEFFRRFHGQGPRVPQPQDRMPAHGIG